MEVGSDDDPQLASNTPHAANVPIERQIRVNSLSLVVQAVTFYELVGHGTFSSI
jgi:hypothetical protein